MKKADDAAVDRLLSGVQKPGRYCGGEFNSIVKKDAAVRAAVSYPDLYEVGMSNSGIKILYDAVNRIEAAACERVFAVDFDMEAALRASEIPLFTLETRTPLCDLDLIGFNLSHELLITNALQIIDLGGIPLLAGERGKEMPIVAAGGGAVSNPAPYADFFDLFFIGDGEEGLTEIIEILIRAKKSSLSRQDKINLLSEIESVYVPGVHGPPEEMRAGAVKKRIFRGSDPSDPVKPVVSGVRAAQDRAVIEISRGCPNLCRFCHSGYYDLPYRKRGAEECAEKIKQIIRNTGYDEVTFSSLSVSDYPDISALLDLTLPWFTERGISVSLPSLRVDPSTLTLVRQVSDLRATSLTFAVESASREIRERAHKRVREDELLEMTALLFSKGWRLLKFYFMLGLPGCEEFDEADATIELIKKVLDTGGRGVDLNVTLSPFVPKPHTPFERERMMPAEYFFESVMRIKRGLPRRVKIKSHDIGASMVEAVISRGDSSIASAILNAYSSGARFDSWGEHFKRRIWDEVFSGLEGGAASYLERRNGIRLPWSFISTGYERVTESMARRVSDLNSSRKTIKIEQGLDTGAVENALALFRKRYTVKSRLLLKFTKSGRARYISHLDYVEVLKRAMRIAELPVAFTRGFRKREKLLTGNPVPLGVESESELVAVDLWDNPASGFEQRLGNALPEGVSLVAVFPAAPGFNPAGGVRGVCYELFLDEEGRRRALECAGKKINFTGEDKKGSLFELSFDEAVAEFDSSGENIVLTLNQSGVKNIRIGSLVRQLTGEKGKEPPWNRLLKKGQYIETGFL